MALKPMIIELDDLEHLSPVLDVMRECTETGHGWINVQAEVDPDDLPPPPSLLTQIIRRSSPDAALGTWTPPMTGQPKAPQNIGVQHRHGTKLIPLLDDFGIERPETWRRIQDSPRRGLVVAVPHDTPHEEVLSWLLRLVMAATPLQTTGRWLIARHPGRSA